MFSFCLGAGSMNEWPSGHIMSLWEESWPHAQECKSCQKTLFLTGRGSELYSHFLQHLGAVNAQCTIKTKVFQQSFYSFFSFTEKWHPIQQKNSQIACNLSHDHLGPARLLSTNYKFWAMAPSHINWIIVVLFLRVGGKHRNWSGWRR